MRRLQRPQSNADTALIDMHPATRGDWSDAAMDVGQVFSDPLQQHHDPERRPGRQRARRWRSTSRATRVPPSAPGGLTAVAGGTTVALHWTAASDDYAVDVLSRHARWRAGRPTARRPTSPTRASCRARPSAYTVAAVDAGGNLGPPASAGLAIPDGDAPERAGARDGAADEGRARCTSRGRRRADNGRVASYRVRRNGKPIATGPGLAYVDKVGRSPAAARA